MNSNQSPTAFRAFSIKFSHFIGGRHDGCEKLPIAELFCIFSKDVKYVMLVIKYVASILVLFFPANFTKIKHFTKWRGLF